VGGEETGQHVVYSSELLDLTLKERKIGAFFKGHAAGGMAEGLA
jgi:hypothetical protein